MSRKGQANRSKADSSEERDAIEPDDDDWQGGDDWEPSAFPAGQSGLAGLERFGQEDDGGLAETVSEGDQVASAASEVLESDEPTPRKRRVTLQEQISVLVGEVRKLREDLREECFKVPN